jgi:S-adenosylmethionine decarboxylase
MHSAPRIATHPPSPAGASAPVGEHLLADLYGIDPARLTDEAALTACLGGALEDARFTVVDQVGHAFPGEPTGVTVLFLLAESHASLHTYPERGYAAMDVFSCGAARPQDVLDAVIRVLEPEAVRTSRHARGGPATDEA